MPNYPMIWNKILIFQLKDCLLTLMLKHICPFDVDDGDKWMGEKCCYKSSNFVVKGLYHCVGKEIELTSQKIIISYFYIYLWDEGVNF